MADVIIRFAAEPLIQGQESRLASVNSWWLEMMVRLKPGQSVEQANAALRGVQPQIRAATLAGWNGGDPARYLNDPTLGGSRWRLARLLFTESLLVATSGAALGIVFAVWGGALLVQQLST